MPFIQEAVDIKSGDNFMPKRMRYRLPLQKNDVSVFLLSDSFEYDIELIKNIPQPKMDYRSVLIPYRVFDKFGVKVMRYMMTASDYNAKALYVNSQKMTPKLINLKYPYPKEIQHNLYIPLTDFQRL